MSRGTRRAAWIAGVLLALIAAQCLGFWVPGLDVLLYLLVGWVPYLKRVGPQIDVRWDLVASTFAYAAALLVGSHLFLRWLYREMRKRGEAGGADAEAPAWRWRWTLGGFAILVLMFAAGTAAVGITHQTAWLARSPEPLYRPGGMARIAERVKCATKLRQIGQALSAYADAHDGRFPDDLGVLVAEEHLDHPEALICPAAHSTPPDQVTSEHVPGLEKPHLTTYIYFAAGLSMPVGETRVLVVEPLENHQGEGINVLYANGHAEWMHAPEAEKLLLSLGFQRVEAPPRR